MPASLEHAATSWKGQRAKGRPDRIAGTDPRVRLMVAVLLAGAVVFSTHHAVMAAGLAVALLTALAARLAPKPTAKRVLTMDGFIIVMIVMLPFTTPGTPLFAVGPLEASAEGVSRGVDILLKANAVVLLLLALVGTMEAVTLGHALSRLGAPARLVHILLFTVRYLDVIGREYKRMRNAMKARAFQPRSNPHTWRSIGYLLGMLLIRSLDRSERILAAMRCRGYRNRLHLVDSLTLVRADLAFLVAGTLLAGALLSLDRMLA